MIQRIYLERKKGLDQEANQLLEEIRNQWNITSCTGLRILVRFDVEGLSEEEMAQAIPTVFSEPAVDQVVEDPFSACDHAFAVQYLPGQFDQRADSAEQCVQMLTQKDRPLVRSAKVYLLQGQISDRDFQRIRSHLINPVEACPAPLDLPDTLTVPAPRPRAIETLENFRTMSREGLEAMVKDLGLAMDGDDLKMTQDYFQSLRRDPTMTEIRVLDTYWSDHCRHTTFHTILDHVTIEDESIDKAYRRYLATRKALGRTKPICLMDIGTLAAKQLIKDGRLKNLDESEEINACTVKTKIKVDGREEEWLFLFKNETHNHPTEIEPFGGAATCIGGAIRDPLSGRSYVYAAMRVTGAGDPRTPLSETLPDKLPQRTICKKAADGYSSYGNQIGLATGQVTEIYHPGYVAKRMEVGAVVAAAPRDHVRRERPLPGDLVLLVGGRTGRDGIGGATGSSKSHTSESLHTAGAEVQKGNAPEERKLQRLFSKKEVSRLIKRCNDFGAGGVSVAVGELAEGLDIDLDKVPLKYSGLNGTEIAISESQERMAVVIAKEDKEFFLQEAEKENVEATVIAKVTEEAKLRMSWQGTAIVDLDRSFLDTNGSEKHQDAVIPKRKIKESRVASASACDQLKALLTDPNFCSQQALSEQFDSTVGARSVLMPFGGRHQKTPIQAMVHTLPVMEGHTDSCSFMAYGFDPYLSQEDPYRGAYLAVVDSVSKLIATGCPRDQIYLTFQEYFERLRNDPLRWGKPLAALLGAFEAQLDLGYGAIGGKDSMSGSFEDLDVPPTLISFAVGLGTVSTVTSGEFKGEGHPVTLLLPKEEKERQIPETESLSRLYDDLSEAMQRGEVLACRSLDRGSLLTGLYNMAIGNDIGFQSMTSINDLLSTITCPFGAFLVESEKPWKESDHYRSLPLGQTVGKASLCLDGNSQSLDELLSISEATLSSIYRLAPKKKEEKELPRLSAKNETGISYAYPALAKPRVLIPAFPGTNCEMDSLRAVEDAGLEGRVFVLNNLSGEGIQKSINACRNLLDESQMLFLPGGFSGGDEPNGSAKFISSFFRNPEMEEALGRLIDERAGLVLGICNGFQALIKLGLVPYGKIVAPDPHLATLAGNTIGRHQSKIVRTRIVSNRSPWLSKVKVGQVFRVPISHGEGRFLATDDQVRQLAEQGQIATQYVDEEGQASMDPRFNPNGSVGAVEGITSPDGRIFGKMGHAERIGKNLYKNVPGEYDLKLFRAAKEYFKN